MVDRIELPHAINRQLETLVARSISYDFMRTIVFCYFRRNRAKVGYDMRGRPCSHSGKSLLTSGRGYALPTELFSLLPWKKQGSKRGRRLQWVRYQIHESDACL